VPDLFLLYDSGAVTVVDVKPQHRVSDPGVAAVFRVDEQGDPRSGLGVRDVVRCGQ